MTTEDQERSEEDGKPFADPPSVTGDQVRAAYDALGLDPEGWRSTSFVAIELAPHAVTVVRYRRNAEGKAFLDEKGETAQTATIIPIVWSLAPTP